MHTFHKTRIAPTPSGFLHIGNALSFALTAALARRTGAKVLLRIDDMDKERVQPAYVQDIFDTLHFLEIPWQEGPANIEEYQREYSQRYRMPLYEQALKQLADSGAVFACSCSRAMLAAHAVYPGTCCKKQLPLNTPDTSWRLFTDTTQVLKVHTLDGIQHHTLPPDMQYFVVRKKDGYPAYQLASVIDDIYFGVDLIVRGQDLWGSTLAQHYLAIKSVRPQLLAATFYHHSLLMVSGTEKLSKSAGATSIQYLRKEGKKASDIYTMIAVMLGISQPVKNWEELGGLILKGTTTNA